VLKKANLLKGRRQGKWMHYKIDDSDFFKRLILIQVLEKIPCQKVEGDRKRLEEFIKNKEDSKFSDSSRGSCCLKNKRRI
jgi:ArsR family transcriptional regulator, arsenate/arsenite/antimonite-responsive transcriptional repressor